MSFKKKTAYFKQHVFNHGRDRIEYPTHKFNFGYQHIRFYLLSSTQLYVSFYLL